MLFTYHENEFCNFAINSLIKLFFYFSILRQYTFKHLQLWKKVMSLNSKAESLFWYLTFDVLCSVFLSEDFFMLIPLIVHDFGCMADVVLFLLKCCISSDFCKIIHV